MSIAIVTAVLMPGVISYTYGGWALSGLWGFLWGLSIPT